MPPIDPFPCGNGLHPCPPEPAIAWSPDPKASPADSPDQAAYSYNEMKKHGAACAEWGKKQPKE